MHVSRSCSIHPELCRAAAREGKLGVLQWARANGFRWNADVCSAAAGR
ncbi:unnamed protein product, partial [Laminaria digitata]